MTSLDDRLANLKVRFLERAREDLRTIDCIDTTGTINEVDREVLVSTSHKLAGLSGTLGFADISAAAFALEKVLLDRPQAQQVEAKAVNLKQLLRDLTD